MQKVRRHSLILADRAPTVCKRPVSDLFHSPFGVLFTFPSRYLFTIGQSGVFSLGGRSPHVQTAFRRVRLYSRAKILAFAYRTITYYCCAFHHILLTKISATGLVPVRSPLLRESLLLSFPAGTEMFHFSAFASLTYVFSQR